VETMAAARTSWTGGGMKRSARVISSNPIATAASIAQPHLPAGASELCELDRITAHLADGTANLPAGPELHREPGGLDVQRLLHHQPVTNLDDAKRSTPSLRPLLPRMLHRGIYLAPPSTGPVREHLHHRRAGGVYLTACRESMKEAHGVVVSCWLSLVGNDVR
jgi:glutamate-1-semialdehyde aminotransferase